MHKCREEVEDFLKRLERAVEKESSEMLGEELQSFNEWLQRLNDEVKAEILTYAMPKIVNLQKELEIKKGLFKEMLVDNNEKHSANKKYSKY